MNNEYYYSDIVDRTAGEANIVSEAQMVDAFRNNKKEKETVYDVAESLAWGFAENQENVEYGWGGWYGPCFIMSTGDGMVSVSPHKKYVTDEVYSYWSKRAEQVSHPLLINRYYDLLIDFADTEDQRKKIYSYADHVINSAIAVSEQRLHKYGSSIKLQRALNLANKFNKSKSDFEKIILAILKYDAERSEDNLPGTWTSAYDLLLVNGRVRHLTKSQEEEIISRITNRFNDSLQNQQEIKNPTLFEVPGLRLARYYQRNNETEKLSEICHLIENAYMNLEKQDTTMYLWNLEQVQRIYSEFNLRADEQRIVNQISQKQSLALENLQRISTTVNIDFDKFDQFVEQELLAGDFYNSIISIEDYFTPKLDELKESIKRTYSQAPFISMHNINLLDHDGRKISEIGSVEKDVEGRLAYEMKTHISFQGIFLNRTIEKLFEKYNLSLDSLLETFSKSPIFDSKRSTILREGLNQYLSKNYIASISILIPLVENLFMRVLQALGEPVMLPNKSGGYDYISMGTLLEKRSILISKFGEDRVKYWRVLFTEKAGFNLRNDFAHGLFIDSSFDYIKADRILHVLMFFAILRVDDDCSA